MRKNVPLAYSNLPKVLEQCRIKVPGLKARLQAMGINVNPKSLYRLTTHQPLKKIDTTILAGICLTCEVGIQDLILFERPQVTLHRLGKQEQAKLDALMERNNEGKLTRLESTELAQLSEKAHEMTIRNARILASHRTSLGEMESSVKGGKGRATKKSG